MAACGGYPGRGPARSRGVHAQSAAGSGRRAGRPGRDAELCGRGDHPAIPAGHLPFLGRQRPRRGPARAHHRLPGRRRPARLGLHQRALVHPPRPGGRQHRLPRHRQPDRRGRSSTSPWDGKTVTTTDHRHGSMPRAPAWGPCSPAGQTLARRGRGLAVSQYIWSRCGPASTPPALRGGPGQDTGATATS